MGEEDVQRSWMLVVADLVAGREHSRTTVAARLNKSLSTADRLLDDVREAFPQLRRRKEGTTTWLSLPRRSASAATLVGACILASMGRMFRGSEHERGLADVRDMLLEEASAAHPGLDRKFFLHRRGGELALPEAGRMLDSVVTAILTSRKLRIGYSGLDARTLGPTLIEPLSLVVFEHQFYVLARREDGSFYPFRFARIETVDADHETFKYPSKAEFDPQAILEAGFGMHLAGSSPPEHVEIELTGRWAKYALSHRWHPSQTVTQKLDRRASVITLRVALCPELETWILGFGEFALVIKPAKLRNAVAKRAQAMGKLYVASVTARPSVAKASGKAERTRPTRRRRA